MNLFDLRTEGVMWVGVNHENEAGANDTVT
jgi:hypothetical protein